MTLYKKQFLITKAQEFMQISKDPIHDLSHVTRVVSNSKRIAQSFPQLTNTDLEALELAAWWHDVSRTLTDKPSFVWMACIDDMVSALMLCVHSIRYGFWKHSGGVATRLILAKSLGTGALFTKLFLRGREKTLLNILRDADMLDILNTERLEKVCILSQESKKYFWGLKCLTFINIHTSVTTKMRTPIAQQYFAENLETLIQWITVQQNDTVIVTQFGKKWLDSSHQHFMHMHRQLS